MSDEEVAGVVEEMSLEQGYLVLRDAAGKRHKVKLDLGATTIVKSASVRVGKRKMYSMQTHKLHELPTGTDVVVQLGRSNGKGTAEQIRMPFTEGNHAIVRVFYATDRRPTKEVRSEWTWLLEDFWYALTAVVAVIGLFLSSRKKKHPLLRGLAWASLALTVVLSVLAVHASLTRLSKPVEAQDYYSNERGGGLEVGSCTVTVPLDHRIGEIEAPSILRFEFRYDPERHIVLDKVEPLVAAEFQARLQDSLRDWPAREALVFVHGFKTSFEAAALRTAQLTYDLKFPGAAIMYSWPSQGAVLRYTVDETNAEWAVYHLRSFLKDLAESNGLDRLHLIAHSMGNRVLAGALLHLRNNEALRAVLNEVILAAPDIDADVFRRDIVPALKATARRVTLYASSRDQALATSKQIHGYPRAGETGSNLVVHPDVDTIDVSEVDTSLLGHSYYGDNRSLISDLMTLLLDRLPPQQRKHLLPRKHQNLPYWLFAAASAGE